LEPNHHVASPQPTTTSHRLNQPPRCVASTNHQAAKDACRLAFYGYLVKSIGSESGAEIKALQDLKVFKVSEHAA
jgi:hypothetical protein